MFRWYQKATRCYVYLSDVSTPDAAGNDQSGWEDAFRKSRWMTRGWTLQELLAPSTVDFVSNEGKQLDSKISLELEIHEITKVPIAALRGQQHLSEYSISERMSWAAHRLATYAKDKIYCLLGIFGVYLITEREMNMRLNCFKTRYNVVQIRKNGEMGRAYRICLVRLMDIVRTVFCVANMI